MGHSSEIKNSAKTRLLWPFLTAAFITAAISIFWISRTPPIEAHFSVVEVPEHGIDLYLKNEGIAPFSVLAGSWWNLQSRIEEGVLMVSKPINTPSPKTPSLGGVLVGGGFSGWNGRLQEIKEDESKHLFSLSEIRPPSPSIFQREGKRTGIFQKSEPSPEPPPSLPSTFIITIRAEKQLSRFGKWKNQMLGKFSELDRWFERAEPESVPISSPELPLPADFFADLVDLEETGNLSTESVIIAD